MSVKRTSGPSGASDESPEELRSLFGANFRQARLKAKLTQAEVAARTGIQQHYISEVENGLWNLTINTMTMLAHAVGTNVRTLLRPPPKRS